MPGDEEVPLAGGNLTRVVRVDDTVRRAAGPWTPLVHDLLDHVRDRGFLLAPEPLGIDGRGREVLAYLPGETVTAHPWPRWVWSDSLLVEAGAALADYHRAVADFRPAVIDSRLGPTVLGAGDIVCHNDFAPYNSVFRAGHLAGVFDWDVVCAAPPVWDLAFAAWHWIPLHAPSKDLAWRTTGDCERRLCLLLDAYGLSDATGFLETIAARIEASRSGIVERAAAGDDAFVRLEREGHATGMARALEFVRSIQEPLTRALEEART